MEYEEFYLKSVDWSQINKEKGGRGLIDTQLRKEIVGGEGGEGRGGGSINTQLRKESCRWGGRGGEGRGGGLIDTQLRKESL